MKIVIRPALEPRRELDLTHRLTAAIAEELWRSCGGNERLNWLEAERHLARIFGGASPRADAAGVVVSPEIIREQTGGRERAGGERARNTSGSGASLPRERRAAMRRVDAGASGRRRVDGADAQRPAAALTAV